MGKLVLLIALATLLPGQEEPPVQGEIPEHTWPPEPHGLQDHGNLMMEPQSIVNPPGPKVHAPHEHRIEEEG